MTGVVHVCVAMKPLDGNFAENALKHGVAGLNIDGCRIGTGDKLQAGSGGLLSNVRDDMEWGCHAGKGESGFVQNSGGRWPANVIHDGSEEVIGAFPHSKNTRHMSYKRGGGEFIDGIQSQPEKGWHVMEDGSAARFFKQAGEFHAG